MADCPTLGVSGHQRPTGECRMSEEKQSLEGRIDLPGLTGIIWVIGWMFTIGFADLSIPRLIYAAVLWPYYLGAALA